MHERYLGLPRMLLRFLHGDGNNLVITIEDSIESQAGSEDHDADYVVSKQGKN